MQTAHTQQRKNTSSADTQPNWEGGEFWERNKGRKKEAIST